MGYSGYIGKSQSPEVEALVFNRDIGFVVEDQEATVKWMRFHSRGTGRSRATS